MKNHSSDEHFYQLWVLLNQARDAAFRAREKELSVYGLTGIQAGVLFVIKTIGEKATPSEISRWLLREPHTISSLVDRMQKEGLVTKARKPGKKREIMVTLTEKGAQAYNQSLNRGSIKEIMSCLSEQELRQLRPLLERIRDKSLKELITVKEVPFP